MEIIRYSAVGEKNKIRNFDNQDSMTDKRYRNYRVLAVSDGAGSCKHSAVASRVACTSAADYWINNIPFIKTADCGLIAENTMTVVQYFLRKAAEANGHDYREYCCTLIMCLINEKNGELVTLHVGDGSIYELGEHDIQRISKPENGLFSYQTFFVNSDDSIGHCRIQRYKTKNGIMLCSDGLDSLFESDPSVRMGFIATLSDTSVYDAMQKSDDTSFAFSAEKKRGCRSSPE